MAPIKRLLLATDLSREARSAELWACAMAASWNAHLMAMTVLEFPDGVDPDQAVNQDHLVERTREASDKLMNLKQFASGKQLDVEIRVATGLPCDLVRLVAEVEKVDMIIVGAKGKHGLSHGGLGSTTGAIIRTAPCPVLVAPKQGNEQVKSQVLDRMLIPIDFSDCSLDALEYAVTIARQSHASIELLHIVDPACEGIDDAADVRSRQIAIKNLTKRLEEVSAGLLAGGIYSTIRVEMGIPSDAIINRASEASHSLIVMGVHGRRGQTCSVAGSVTQSVLRRASCPVLVVRTPKFGLEHNRRATDQTSREASGASR
ncbi:universal stress protein [Nitrospira sp. KM1]|uniref:universal stress protein n=1 Tax=Nitrospira sp. KM1 TaxID=1936990 RepID=UPI0013A79E39|nr:universal stress protein [Nitrospira sp. KM1]BCA54927.1 universal stress protein [Nitrospira sp. KM1]